MNFLISTKGPFSFLEYCISLSIDQEKWYHFPPLGCEGWSQWSRVLDRSLHFSTMGQWTGRIEREREAGWLLAKAVKSVLANWVTCLNQAALIFMWSIRGRSCEKSKGKKKGMMSFLLQPCWYDSYEYLLLHIECIDQWILKEISPVCSL